MATTANLASEQSAAAWRDFEPGNWTEHVDVRDFIQRNYTPYEGDGTFLAGATERTKGTLDVSQVPSSILAHAPGRIDRNNEIIVGLQTDAPLDADQGLSTTALSNSKRVRRRFEPVCEVEERARQLSTTRGHGRDRPEVQ